MTPRIRDGSASTHERNAGKSIRSENPARDAEAPLSPAAFLESTPALMSPNELSKAGTPVSSPSPEALHRVLSGLLEISHLVGSVMLLDDILDRIVEMTARLMAVPVCSIYLLDENRQLVLRSTYGLEPELKGKVRFDIGTGIVGIVAETGETLALPDSTVDPRYHPLPSSRAKGYRGYLCSPLRIQEEIIGVMTARKAEAFQFAGDDLLFFETVCKQVAILIEKARMYDEKLQAERLAAVAVSLSGVAHYIKNVLLTMQGGEYLVEHGIEKGELARVKDGWTVLRRANRKIRGLVENILNYCRQTSPNLRAVNLNVMIADMVRTVAESQRERGVEVAAELDDGVGEIWIDAEMIYDALLNLVTNAVEAVPEERQGSVRVRTEQLEGRHQVLVQVIDNGGGIPEAVRDKIFNLFFSTKGRKGTGIGLAATRKIVEDHGGSIELASEEGVGTSFSIYLPTNAHAMTHANTHAAAAAHPF